MHAPAPAALRAVCGALLLIAPVMALVPLTTTGSAPAVAAPAPSAAPSPKPGKKLCRISEPALTEISGMVATENGYTAVADGGTDGDEMLQVFDLNKKCKVTQRHTFQQDPYDPEDLAISADGTLWIADIGDNDLERDTVALWKISPDRGTATIHRLTYPDGKHDAEALLMPANGKPVIIAKDLDGNGESGVYSTKQQLKPDESVPLARVGKVEFPLTGTEGNKLGPLGQQLPTGGAMSPDGKRAVVRTYSDAYQWKVKDGKVVAALTKRKPIRTPLPNEPQGEAITFSADGKTFVTATEGGQGGPARLYSYQPSAAPLPEPSHPKPDRGPGWFDNLQLQDIKLLIALAGVLGVLLVFVGVFGIRRSGRGGRGRKGAPPVRGGGRPRRPARGDRDEPVGRGRGYPAGGYRDGPAGGYRDGPADAAETADLPAVRGEPYPPPPRRGAPGGGGSGRREPPRRSRGPAPRPTTGPGYRDRGGWSETRPADGGDYW